MQSAETHVTEKKSHHFFLMASEDADEIGPDFFYRSYPGYRQQVWMENKKVHIANFA